MSDSMSKPKKKSRGLFNIRIRFKQVYTYMFISLAIFVGTGIGIWSKLMAIEAILDQGSTNKFGVSELINTLLIDVATISLVAFGLFTTVSIAFVVISGHRLTGEVFAISAQLRAMKRSDFSHRRKLRSYDTLHHIVGDLHDLADQFERLESENKRHLTEQLEDKSKRDLK